MDKSNNEIEEKSEERGGKYSPLGETSSSAGALQLKSKSPDDKASKDKRSKYRRAKKNSKKSHSKKVKDNDSNQSSDSDSESESSSDDSNESSDTEESESESKKESKRRAKRKSKRNSKEKKRLRAKRKERYHESSESSESDTDSASDTALSTEVNKNQSSDLSDLKEQLLNLQIQNQQLLQGLTQLPCFWISNPTRNSLVTTPAQLTKSPEEAVKNKDPKEAKEKKVKKKRASKLDYKRIDQVWDKTIHNYKLQDTTEDKEKSEYDQYIFTVRRTFDYDGKYKKTLVDIKSKYLREVMSKVMVGVKGISLVEESPSVDPNLLFLYLEDLRMAFKNLKKIKAKGEERKKAAKRNKNKLQHLKVFLKYLDKDYASTKKTLYPMLESGLITFDLLWALYKPNTLAYTSTYNSIDEPRAFRVELAEKEYSFLKGEWYEIEGRYLEYDGKTWGMGTMSCEVPAFKGARKITSLSCYPLAYHKDEKKLRVDLIERGKKFVSLQGVQYKSHEGMAFYKKKKQIIKVNIHGRIMIDPAIHRRILPNYNISTVKPSDNDLFGSDSNHSDSECGDCGDSSDDENNGHILEENNQDEGEEIEEPKTKWKIIQDEQKKPVVVKVPVDEDGLEIVQEKLEEVSNEIAKDKGTPDESEQKNEIPTFTDDEYLIASPVVLGFSFAEKLWLEFTVSGVKDIVWNEGAYESLVLENNTKSIVKALVESHKYHPAHNIDDVIQGKGKGLVAVLHGPPGTGKTLTAEGISELLRSPLYMVSAGELGTDPRTLEGELQKILDVAHSWGAVLLLDEADIFLEKRTIQDIHRNALVSIFLRLLEYFQGILFLTTNRVETFDDAFQSRIHIALRYGDLSFNAKKGVFKMFIERVRVLEGVETMPFTEEDYKILSKQNLNGRQIKNTIRTAQALAVQKKEPLSMQHIKQVLDMASAFDRDLKGGPGYEEAMRGYF
ncbi:hypothetical protein K3495_g3488 [Podosphaera aphanis]|nr:hypothetical protein K3495_g3488 [Podosphaera aphanis]